MAQQLVGTKYKDMDPAYQESIDRNEYKARRQAQEEAVGRVREYKKSGDKYNSKQAYQVENLDDFDWRANQLHCIIHGHTCSDGTARGVDVKSDLLARRIHF